MNDRPEPEQTIISGAVITDAAHRGTSAPTILMVSAGLVCLYFAFALAPKLWPGLKASGVFVVYQLSIPIVFVTLMALAGAILYRIKRDQSENMNVHPIIRHLLISVCAVIVWGVMLVAAYWLLPAALPTGSNRMQFDREAWMASPRYVPGEITPRQMMLGDVIGNVLPGRTKVEIEELLGPPSTDYAFRSLGSDLVYQTGVQRDSWVKIDSEWLLIWVDSSGMYQRYKVVSD